MFNNLTRNISGILAGLRRKGKLTEDDVNEVLREVRVALLEADVNFGVAKALIARIKEQAIGEAVFGSLNADTPALRASPAVRGTAGPSLTPNNADTGAAEEAVALPPEEVSEGEVTARKVIGLTMLAGALGSVAAAVASRLGLLKRKKPI